MRGRHSAKLAAIGALSLAAVLGSSLPSTAAPAPGAADTDLDREVSVKTFFPSAGLEQSIQTFACPPQYPWLENVTSALGVRGTKIDNLAYAAGDVTLNVRLMRDREGLAVGWDGHNKAVSISEKNPGTSFTVIALCTNDRSKAYPG